MADEVRDSRQPLHEQDRMKLLDKVKVAFVVVGW